MISRRGRRPRWCSLGPASRWARLQPAGRVASRGALRVRVAAGMRARGRGRPPLQSLTLARPLPQASPWPCSPCSTCSCGPLAPRAPSPSASSSPSSSSGEQQYSARVWGGGACQRRWAMRGRPAERAARPLAAPPPPPRPPPPCAPGWSSPSPWRTPAASWPRVRRSKTFPRAPTRSPGTSRRPTGPATRSCSSWPRACCPLAPSLWSCTLP